MLKSYDRSHRERKEAYVGSLEKEVLKLRRLYEECQGEKKAFLEENAQLKALLQQHGILLPGGGFDIGAAGLAQQPSGLASGILPSNDQGVSFPASSSDLNTTQQGVDCDQLGIDFVLTYDRTPYLSPPP